MLILQALLGSLFLLQKLSFYHFNLKTVVRGSPETLGRQCFCSSCKKCCPFFLSFKPSPPLLLYFGIYQDLFLWKNCFVSGSYLNLHVVVLGFPTNVCKGVAIPPFRKNSGNFKKWMVDLWRKALALRVGVGYLAQLVNPNWRLRPSTDDPLVLTSLYQLLLILPTLFTFLQNKLP